MKLILISIFLIAIIVITSSPIIQQIEQKVEIDGKTKRNLRRKQLKNK